VGLLEFNFIPVLRLGVHGGIPIRVVKNDRISTSEIDTCGLGLVHVTYKQKPYKRLTKTSAASRQNENKYLHVAVKAIHHDLSVFDLHIPCEKRRAVSLKKSMFYTDKPWWRHPNENTCTRAD